MLLYRVFNSLFACDTACILRRQFVYFSFQCNDFASFCHGEESESNVVAYTNACIGADFCFVKRDLLRISKRPRSFILVISLVEIAMTSSIILSYKLEIFS